MPDFRETFAEWIAAKGALRDCPFCEGGSWDFPAFLSSHALLREVAGSPVRQVAPERLVPLVHLRCKNCGFLASFSAETIGIEIPDA